MGQRVKYPLADMRYQLLILIAAMALTACTENLGPQANISRLGLSAPTANRLTLCPGFECRFRDQIMFSETELRQLARIMGKPKTAQQERERVAMAIAWFEKKAGQEAGTADDKGGLNFLSGVIGQQDCIDESTTTTNFLVLMQKNELLTHHRVGGIAARGFLLDGRYPHATATILNRKTGRAWAIDTRVNDNGAPPVIMALERWMDQKPAMRG